MTVPSQIPSLNPSKQQAAILLLLILGLLSYLARVYWMDEGKLSLYDDAYISFRYARNLATGEGLVFNPGERVEGYTNFLWTAILAGAIKLGGDAIVTAKVLGIASGGLILVVSVLLAGTLVPHGGAWVAIPALLLAATASLPRYAISGMETLFFVLWLSLGLLFLFGVDRPRGIWLAALTFALAALTRPEGVLFFGVVMATWSIERVVRKEAWRPIMRDLILGFAVFSAVLLPFLLWRYSYYGYLLPNSYYAKAGGLSLAAIGRGLTYIQNELLILNLPIVLWTVLVVFTLGKRGVPTMLAGVCVYLLYLIIIGGDDWAVFGPRFVLVILPWLTVLGLVGLTALTSTRPYISVIVCIVALGLVGGLSYYEAIGYRGVVNTMNRGWWTTAEWLQEKASPDELVAVDAAGIIPYHTDLPTLDMLGLNDTHIAHLPVSDMGSGLAGHEKFDPSYVIARRPTYIASWLDATGRPLSAGLAQESDRLLEQYGLAAVFLMGSPDSDQPAWVDLSDSKFSKSLNDRGYIYGIFRHRADMDR